MHRILRSARNALALGMPATLAALTLLGAPSAASAATPPITFNIEIFGSCVAGNAADGATVNVTWKDSTGALKVSGVAGHPYDTGGSFSINMRTDVSDFFERHVNIQTGDRVVIGCMQTTGDVVQLQLSAN